MIKKLLFSLIAGGLALGIYLVVVTLLITFNERPLASRMHSWRSFYTYDPITGWALEPNKSGWIPLHGKLKYVQTNALGMRDDPVAPTPSPDRKRILFLGDSFLYDLGAGQDTRYDSRVEFWLNRRGLNTEILNTGVAGFGTDQEYLSYLHRWRSLKSELVILHLYIGNDIVENAGSILKRHYSRTAPKPYFSLNATTGKLQRENFPYNGSIAHVWGDYQNHPIEIFGFRPFRLFGLRALRLHENLLNEFGQYLREVWIFKVGPLLGYDRATLVKEAENEDAAKTLRPLSRFIGPLVTAEPEPCPLYTSPSPRDRQKARMPSSA